MPARETKFAVAVGFSEVQLEDFMRSLISASAQLSIHRRTDLGLVEFLRSFDGDLGSRRHDEKALTKLLDIYFLP